MALTDPFTSQCKKNKEFTPGDGGPLRRLKASLARRVFSCKQASKPLLGCKSVCHFRQNSHLSYSNMYKFALYHNLLVDYCETVADFSNRVKYSFHHFHRINNILCNFSRFFFTVCETIHHALLYCHSTTGNI